MKKYSALLAICVENSPATGELPAQRPVTRSFDVFLICVWINGWVNNREAGDFRRYRAHYDVTVMWSKKQSHKTLPHNIWYWLGGSTAHIIILTKDILCSIGNHFTSSRITDCQWKTLQWRYNEPDGVQINSVSIFSPICSGTDQIKHQSFSSLSFMIGNNRWPMDPPHKWQVSGKCFHLMALTSVA